MENMILMGSIVDDALEAIQTGLLWVCLCLDNAVYSLVNFVYQIILVLARVNVFEDTSVIDNFVNRVYIIIGVVALFLLAYSLLKALINPDEGLKGKNSPQKVIANVLISIALIAFTPTIFSVAMGFQNSLLEQGTLTGIIVGSSGAEESAQTISDGGFNLAAGVFQAFFHPNSDYCQYFINSIPGEENINLTGSGCTELEVLNGTYTYSAFWESMSGENSFSRLPELNKDILGKIDYTWLLSTAVGIFVVIVLVSYCIDIAIRAIKLAAYQLIAPIPILARLLPGDQGSKVFSNWVKACISTYLEVFIRLGILFFVVLIIAALQRNIGGLFSTFQTDAGFGIGFLAWAFLIVGLIFFIKDFPNVIKEITGLDSGKYKMFGGIKNMLTAGAAGTALVGGAIAGHSALAGVRAARTALKDGNLKGIGEQQRRWLAKQDAKDQGARFTDRATDRMRQAFGLGSKLDKANRNVEHGRDLDGDYLTVHNDTGRELKYKDEKGNVIVIGDKDALVMDEVTLNNLQHQKDQNKIAISKIEEQIRQLKEYQGVNSKFIDIRSKIKSEARDKIAEGDSALTDVLEYNGKTVASGNYKALSDYYQSRINAGADQNELKALSEGLKKANDRLWVQYANNEIKKGPGTKIGSLFEQGKNYYNTMGGFYNADTKSFEKIDSSLDINTMEFFEGKMVNGTKVIGLDVSSKSNNSKIDIKINDQELGKNPYNDQNAQIDRLTGQFEELKTSIKTSPKYQRYKASDIANKIKDSGKK